MHFSRQLLTACLVAGQWLFVGAALLALTAIAADWLRGDSSGRPGVMAGIALGCLSLSGLFWILDRLLRRIWRDR